MKHTPILLLSLLLCLMLTACHTTVQTDGTATAHTPEAVLRNEMPETMPEDFNFTLTFGTWGTSFYDSATGKLVKTTDATHPEDYITNTILPDETLQELWTEMRDMDILSYPDIYDPTPDVKTSPSVTLVLSVTYGATAKTISCQNIAMTENGADADGQAFLSLCSRITAFLRETDAWKSLPDYEFYYD